VRIAYVSADFGIPVLGYKGASVHVREMISALASAGHEVCLLTPNVGSGNALPDTIPVWSIAPDQIARGVRRLGKRLSARSRLPKESEELLYNVALYREGAERMERFRPELIYERYSLFTFAGLSLARRFEVPHLLEVNAPLRLERARTKGLVLDRVAARVERHVFGGSDGVFAVSTALRRYLVQRGASEAKSVVLPNGVDVDRFRVRPPDAAVRARLGVPAVGLVVGFAGSLKPWHGTDLLIEAFRPLASMHPDARLLIIGEGPEWEALHSKTRALGLERAVVFTGRIDHAEMPACLNAMDIAVAPYREVEDFYFSPLKLYEYMAAGLAVVASEVGEIGGLVQDGISGLLCPPSDAPSLSSRLLQLGEDAELRRRLGAAARAEARRHSWSNNARAITEYAAEVQSARMRMSSAAPRLAWRRG
jgi:glycosyltransferase involved in cell wall biosynthesis